jgi:hypothetical protein
MKKVFIISAIALSGLIYKSASAQIGVRIGLGFAPRRIETVDQPQQYVEQNDDYYYLPEVDAYYNVYEQCYYYFDGENWISSAYLPGEYRDYDWSNAPRYEVRAVRPYLNDDFYRNRFHGHEAMAWKSRSYGNHSNNVYADRGYRNDAPRFDNRSRGEYNEQSNPREYRGGNQNFDNRRPDNSFQREQPNMRGGDNRESFDNHMSDRSQPNQNENHGENRGDQRFDTNRQNNKQQPNQNQGYRNQNRGGQSSEKNNNDNNQRQAPNARRDNQNRGSDQPNHEGGRFERRMA